MAASTGAVASRGPEYPMRSKYASRSNVGSVMDPPEEPSRTGRSGKKRSALLALPVVERRALGAHEAQHARLAVRAGHLGEHTEAPRLGVLRDLGPDARAHAEHLQ